MTWRARFCAATLAALVLILGCGGESSKPEPEPFTESDDTSYSVAAACSLLVNDFVGSVAVSPGEAGVVRVTSTKRARSQADLDAIVIEIEHTQNRVSVVTHAPQGLQNVSVDLDIHAPPDAIPRLTSGVGSISYEGQAPGQTYFETGVGELTLALPVTVNVEVELTVGVGTIYLDFPVVGEVTEQHVDGVIGNGTGGRIRADVGVGDLHVIAL
jgi:hypothetical protein